MENIRHTKTANTTTQTQPPQPHLHSAQLQAPKSTQTQKHYPNTPQVATPLPHSNYQPPTTLKLYRGTKCNTATRLTTPWLPTIQPQSTAPLPHYRCRMWPNYTSAPQHPYHTQTTNSNYTRALPRHQVHYRRGPITLEFYQGTKCTTATPHHSLAPHHPATTHSTPTTLQMPDVAQLHLRPTKAPSVPQPHT